MPLPSWLVKKTPKWSNIKEMRDLLNDSSLHTVCEEALCPNVGECYSKKNAAFMILGNICTRACGFCSVKKGIPLPPDPDEPKKIAQAAKRLNLKYVVITSVTRDDLEDGGAQQFVLTINEIRKNDSVETIHESSQQIKIEVLIPDFMGKTSSLQKIIAAKPNIINHNLETVPRLYPKLRPQADYKRSLGVLKVVKNAKNGVYTKSGIMVGLGETKEEVVRLMEDLRFVDCDIMTIGQYLRPSASQIVEAQYIEPQLFEEYKQIGEKLGFKKVFSGPFVRSSYMASEIDV